MTTKAMILGSAAHAILSSPMALGKTSAQMERADEVVISPGGAGFELSGERRLHVVERDADLPDRLCIERHSRFYSTAITFVGVRIEGAESRDVVEYCQSERWVRLAIRNDDDKIKREPGSSTALQATLLEDVEIEVYWKVQPSRQVRRALRRIA